jgi:hypothetical protein
MKRAQTRGIRYRKTYCRMILKMRNVWDHAAKNLDIFLEENNVNNA